MPPIDPSTLPEWMRNMIDLRTDVVRWPLDAFNVGKFGAHNAVRNSPSDGLCGPKPGEPTPNSADDEARIVAARYPCTHKGADLSAAAGADVVVPKDGWLLYHGPATSAPFVGYGPNVALIAHSDLVDSWVSRAWKWATGPLVKIFDIPENMVSLRYSLIGHFDMVGPGKPLVADIWDSVNSKPNPDHWRRLKSDPDTVGMMTDADGHDDDRKVFAGYKLGTINPQMGHVHWEIRTSPLADKSRRFDPIEMWRQAYGLPLPQGAKVAQASGGGAGWLLLLALLALSDRRKRR